MDAADHDRAGDGARLNETALGQFLQPLPEGRAGDVQMLGHLALGREGLTGGDDAGIEHVGQRVA